MAGITALAREGFSKFLAVPSIVHGIVERLHPELKEMLAAGKRFRMLFIRSRKENPLPIAKSTTMYTLKKTTRYPSKSA